MDDSHINELLDEVENELERVKDVDDILDEVEREIRKEDIDRVLDEVEREVVEKERMEPPENAPTGDDLERYDSEQTGAKAVEDVVEGEPDTVESRAEQDEVSETTPHEDIINPQTASIEDIEKTVEHHQHLERKLTKEQRGEYADYKEVMAAPDDETSEDIAQQCERDVAQVESWQEREKFPTVVRRAMTYETARIVHESEVPAESLEHRIDPESVKEVLDEFREKESLSVSEKSDIVERIYRPNQREDSVIYAELYERGVPLVEDRFREIASEIRTEREVIEEELNKRLGLDTDPHREVRIAVTDSRIYYWNKDASPDRWLNALSSARIHLRTMDTRTELTTETLQHLHIRSERNSEIYYLNDVLRQLGDLPASRLNPIPPEGKYPSLSGEAFHFITDCQRRTFDEVKSMITRIGLKKGYFVSDLKWPEIGKWRIQSVAIAESDCNLSEENVLTYTERDDQRRLLAMQHFSNFGKFKINESPCSKTQEDTKRVRLPSVFGKMMGYWGIPKGDKAIHNRGLIECIIQELNENKCHYLVELVGEDGTFSDRFGITRANVLHAGEKAAGYQERYGISPKVTQEDIDFIVSIADPMEKNLSYEKGERVRIRVSLLDEISEDDSTKSQKANRLIEIIEQERNRLLDDEVNHIIAPLGVQMTTNATYITYYCKSGRLSIEWIAKTSRIEDTIRWALVAPPNHPQKMEKTVEFLRKYPKRVEKVKQSIIADGLDISSIWEEYGI